VKNPAAGLAPPQGTSARYLHECKLGWVASELHPAMGVLFNPSLTPEVKASALSRLDAKLNFMQTQELNGTKFLMGDTVTVADLYAAVVLSWGPLLNVDVSKYPKCAEFMKNVFADAKVAAAQAKMMKAAGQA